MPEEPFHIPNPPIVEAVLDIDCDFPPNFDLRAAQPAIREAMRQEYPKHREQMLHQTQIRQEKDAPLQVQMEQQALNAVQLLKEDEKQLVQFRANGYSFNRLAPYEGLDVYFGEIERTWQIFKDITHPVLIRKVGLRTINRILLPIINEGVSIEDYFETSPRLPDKCGLAFAGFFQQHKAVDPRTQNQVDIILMAQPAEREKLPIILDINAFKEWPIPPEAWEGILEHIRSLRDLKNNVFRNTLTEKCMNLF
jgi:uncharacterized protein (TIGR04255 family)